MLEHAGCSMTINRKGQLVNSISPRARATALPPPMPLLASVKTGILEEGRFVITPGIASQILERFNYQNQRRVEKTHVAKLAIEMKNGVWTEGSQIAFGVMPDQVIHLVNGQHRMHAIVESGASIEFQVLLVPVKTEAELHALYYRFDTVQRARSDSMVMRSTGIAEKFDISKDVSVHAFKAGICIAAGLKAVHGVHRDPAFGTPDGKLDAIEQWWPVVKQYDDLIGPARGKIKRRLMNSQIMAVALVTLRYQPIRAAEFWSGVAKDDGLRKGDARKAMLTVLEDYNFKENTDSALIYTSHCWDAWFQGRTIQFVKATTNSVCAPLGTPFAPKRRTT